MKEIKFMGKSYIAQLTDKQPENGMNIRIIHGDKRLLFSWTDKYEAPSCYKNSGNSVPKEVVYTAFRVLGYKRDDMPVFDTTSGTTTVTPSCNNTVNISRDEYNNMVAMQRNMMKSLEMMASQVATTGNVMFEHIKATNMMFDMTSQVPQVSSMPATPVTSEAGIDVSDYVPPVRNSDDKVEYSDESPSESTDEPEEFDFEDDFEEVQSIVEEGDDFELV